jgi:hypothetical protein
MGKHGLNPCCSLEKSGKYASKHMFSWGHMGQTAIFEREIIYENNL